MLRRLSLLILLFTSSFAQEFQEKQFYDSPALNPYLSEQQQYNPYFNTQYYPNQPLPIQPPLYYSGGSGQPILFNNVPSAPPGNFLIPQTPSHFDPNIYRNQNPLFVAGYPKPAHVPDIDKDAEEVPTDPKMIPQHKPVIGNKPQKIEFDENEPAYIPTRPGSKPTNFQPGQRFFILNGQQLFPNFAPYPYTPERYNNIQPQQHQQQQHQRLGNQFPALQNLYVRNDQQDASKTIPGVYLKDLLPLRLQNQVSANDNTQQDIILKSLQDRDTLQSRYSDKGIQLPLEQLNYYRLPVDIDSDAVVVDAKYQQDDSDSDVIEGVTEKAAESSVAQAQPGAIALAGVGGVAAAGPRGTALAGEGGLAVSSPHATAVAGPSKDGEINDKKSKLMKTKPKQ